MNDIKGYVFLFCAFTLAGTSVVSARFVSGRIGTFTITSVSLGFALVFLLPLCRKKLADAIRKLHLNDLIFLSVQALFGMFLFRLFLLSGLKFTSTGEAGILTGATPAITVILAVAALKEKPDGRKLIGVAGTIAGILMIQGVLTPGSSFSAGHLKGNLLVLCAAACESLFNVFSRSFAVNNASENRSVIDPAVQTTIVSAIALVFCIIPAMFEEPVQGLSGLGTVEWLALVWYGVLVTALAFIFWYAGIKSCGAFAAAAFSGMMPFTAMLLSVALLGESPGLWQYCGGIMIVVGMLLIGKENNEDKKALNAF